MIPVAEALQRLFDLVTPTEAEEVGLRHAAGRVLRNDAVATRAQPPFAASAMDGYAVIGDEVFPGATFTVIGEAAAGRAFSGSVGPGQAVRIFTGAPIPDGADRVVIQEDTARTESSITLRDNLDDRVYVRPAGADFAAGARVSAPRRLKPADLALLAAMNVARVTVARRPTVAVLATGDELVIPGEDPGRDQIVASNVFGLVPMFEAAGALVRLLPIARDNDGALNAALDLARGADLLVTVGGASVGDHDLVGPTMDAAGWDRSFYKIAMRPGKPLMAGRLGRMAMIGLPGNPVSAMVCGEIFVVPMIDAMQGLPALPRRRSRLRLTAPVGANRAREHYMRGILSEGGVAPLDRQDSSLLSVLASADALIVRPPGDPERGIGDEVDVVRL